MRRSRLRCPSACGHWTSHYESVIGFGRAEIVDDAATKRSALQALMHKYSGRDDWEFDGPSMEDTGVVRIRLDALTGKQSPPPCSAGADKA